jgi:hypothetical protein
VGAAPRRRRELWTNQERAGVGRESNAMPRRLIIEIDIPVVVAHLSREEGRDVTEADVRQWLLDAGFTPRGGRWIVNEPDLGQMDPSEVRYVDDAPSE